MPKSKKRRAWPLAQLAKSNKHAATVYVALRYLAGSKRRLATTRARIADQCGLCARVIGRAMHSLSDAGWIRLNYGRAGVMTWYRVSFPQNAFFPVVHGNDHRKQKPPHYPVVHAEYHSKPIRVLENVPQQTITCGTSHAPPLSRERVRRPDALNSDPGRLNQQPMTTETTTHAEQIAGAEWYE